jgi:hypothetical protein
MYFARAILLAMLLLSCASLGFGQKFCRIARSPYKHTASIASRYDDHTHRMKTVLEYPNFDGGGDGFTIYAAFYHHDVKLGFTPTIDLTFLFTSQQSSGQHARDLSLSVNGRPLAFNGPVRFVSQKDRHLAIDTASITITYENLLELTSGRKTEVRLGSTSHKLTEDNLEALRELASLLAPYAQWAKQGGAPGSAWTVR